METGLHFQPSLASESSPPPSVRCSVTHRGMIFVVSWPPKVGNQLDELDDGGRLPALGEGVRAACSGPDDVTQWTDCIH
jgi:hypothetical protein